MLRQVISGGQTGVDRAALVAAKASGLDTGGCMPFGWRAHDGNHPDYHTKYGMKMHHSRDYRPRTELNVKESDATLIISRYINSPGTICTLNAVTKFGKTSLVVRPDDLDTDSILSWLKANHQIVVLNVAGNSDKSAPGIYDEVYPKLRELFSRVKHERELLGAR